MVGNTVATGGAFACAWSPCCTKYAIGCQDGSLAIYDVRTHEPLLQLKSSRVQTKKERRKKKSISKRVLLAHGRFLESAMYGCACGQPNSQHSAIRAVKFAPDPLDLLAYTEVRGPLAARAR